MNAGVYSGWMEQRKKTANENRAKLFHLKTTSYENTVPGRTVTSGLWKNTNLQSVTTLDETPAGTISATDKTPLNPSTTKKTITIDNTVILYQKELKNLMSRDQ